MSLSDDEFESLCCEELNWRSNFFFSSGDNLPKILAALATPRESLDPGILARSISINFKNTDF